MEDKRLSIRPALYLSAKSENEGFQNRTLRPILKLQHNLIIHLFLTSAKKQKLLDISLVASNFSDVVDSFIIKNVVIRNQFIGLVLGQFTMDEFKEYDKNASEYNKRIIGMIKKRISDSFQEIMDYLD